MALFKKGLFGGAVTSGGTTPGGSGTGWDGRVNTFADLPAAASNSGKYYMVDTATGTVGVDYKSAGIYKSNGTVWNLNGTPPLTSVMIGGILVSAAVLGVFGSSTIKVTPDAINGTMTIEGNYTAGDGVSVTGNVIAATYANMSSGVEWENGVPSSTHRRRLRVSMAFRSNSLTVPGSPRSRVRLLRLVHRAINRPCCSTASSMPSALWQNLALLPGPRCGCGSQVSSKSFSRIRLRQFEAR